MAVRKIESNVNDNLKFALNQLQTRGKTISQEFKDIVDSVDDVYPFEEFITDIILNLFKGEVSTDTDIDFIR